MRIKKKPVKTINAMDSAFNLLKFRSRSKKELKDRLALKGIPESAITEVSDRLADMGYIDDLKFAKEWAYSRKMEGKGSALIRNELQRKGVDPDFIKETLVSLYENKDEEMEHLKLIALKKMKTLEKLPPAMASKKLTEYLARRGFQYSGITEVLKSIKNLIETGTGNANYKA